MAAITTHSNGVLWWMIRGKGRCGVFASKTVWSTLERLRGEVLTTFTFTLPTFWTGVQYPHFRIKRWICCHLLSTDKRTAEIKITIKPFSARVLPWIPLGELTTLTQTPNRMGMGYILPPPSFPPLSSQDQSAPCSSSESVPPLFSPKIRPPLAVTLYTLKYPFCNIVILLGIYVFFYEWTSKTKSLKWRWRQVCKTRIRNKSMQKTRLLLSDWSSLKRETILLCRYILPSDFILGDHH